MKVPRLAMFGARGRRRSAHAGRVAISQLGAGRGESRRGEDEGHPRVRGLSKA